MVIIARATGVQMVVMSCNSNTWVICYCLGRNGKTKVLSHLKTASDGADATWRGRSFQTVAPETGNTRLPTVERRTGGTSRRWKTEDRSRCLL